MKQTLLLSTSAPEAISVALKIIQTAGLVAFPTDTVYGLASAIQDPLAIQGLFFAKGRDFNKAIAVLIGDVDQLSQVADNLPPAAGRLAARFWPGALTLVVPRLPSLPGILSPLPTIGVRMPNHPFALSLLRAAGPLATSSANLSGGLNPRTAEEVLEQLAGRIDLVLDGGQCPGGIPSTVVDCTSTEIKILRQGAIPAEEIYKAARVD